MELCAWRCVFVCVSLLCLCECLFAKAYLYQVHFAMNLFSSTVSRLPETILKGLLEKWMQHICSYWCSGPTFSFPLLILIPQLRFFSPIPVLSFPQICHMIIRSCLIIRTSSLSDRSMSLKVYQIYIYSIYQFITL